MDDEIHERSQLRWRHVPRKIKHVEGKSLIRPMREELDELAAVEKVLSPERQDLGNAVQTAFPSAVIVRPAVIFAPDDEFLTTILRLLRSLPAYPIFGNGRTRLQPVYVDDVAAAIAQILRQGQKPYPVYELAGPRVFSYEELLRTIARIAGLRPVLIRMPFAFWGALAGVAEMLPRAPLTRNQVELMQIDSTASESLPRFRSLGISPRSLEDELKVILRQTKPKV
jgi:uncharacterized protein YbjT (DUF2867 family)